MSRPAKYCREQMLDTATGLFWEKGYRGVSIKDLVDATGVLAGSIYSCYGSKDGIFTECVHHYAKTVSAAYIEAEKEPTPLKQIESLFNFLIEDSIGDAHRRGCFVINSLLEIAPDRPEISKVLQQYVAYSEGWIEERLRQAQEQGAIRPEVDCALLAECLFGIVYGTRVKSRANESPDRIRAYVQQMMKALLGPALA